MIKCKVEGCEDISKYAGLCGMHYKRQWRHGDVNARLTTRYNGELCSVEDCENLASEISMCRMHRQRFLRYGRTHNVIRPKGTFSFNAAGYIVISVKGERKYEHILKAEQALGKPLPKGAVVHHMNNCPWDNDIPFNLIICPNQDYHMLLHRRMKELGYGQNNQD